MRYLHDDWPESVTSEGDRQAFLLSKGTPVSLKASLSRFEKTVRFQARGAGATSCTIEDDGGQAIPWHDEVISP